MPGKAYNQADMQAGRREWMKEAKKAGREEGRMEGREGGRMEGREGGRKTGVRAGERESESEKGRVRKRREECNECCGRWGGG